MSVEQPVVERQAEGDDRALEAFRLFSRLGLTDREYLNAVKVIVQPQRHRPGAASAECLADMAEQSRLKGAGSLPDVPDFRFSAQADAVDCIFHAATCWAGLARLRALLRFGGRGFRNHSGTATPRMSAS
jgi:hypothetical protein